MDYPGAELLARIALFRNVPASVLEGISALSFRKRFAVGETVLVQGEPAEAVYIVVVGRLRVTQTASDGQQIILRYLGPGDVVGYAALASAQSQPGTVTVVDDTHLIGWPVATFKTFMANNTPIALNAVDMLAKRYHDLQLRLLELSTEKVEQRIAHTILRLAGQAGRRTSRGVEIAFPLSRQDLAEMCGTTLHTVSRTLSGWEEQSIVDCGRRRVIVTKPDMLTAIANR